MSRQSLDYQSLRADLRADAAAEQVRQVSADGVHYLQSLYAMPVGVRRENLLALAKAVLACPRYYATLEGRGAVKKAVSYYALAPVELQSAPWGRLLVAVRECDAAEADKALDRLVAA